MYSPSKNLLHLLKLNTRPSVVFLDVYWYVCLPVDHKSCLWSLYELLGVLLWWGLAVVSVFCW